MSTSLDINPSVPAPRDASRSAHDVSAAVVTVVTVRVTCVDCAGTGVRPWRSGPCSGCWGTGGYLVIPEAVLDILTSGGAR